MDHLLYWIRETRTNDQHQEQQKRSFCPIGRSLYKRKKYKIERKYIIFLIAYKLLCQLKSVGSMGISKADPRTK